MIAHLEGLVSSVDLRSAVLSVSGVGFRVFCTPSTLGSLRVDDKAMLRTSMVVREDSMTLFGFASDDEREVFETLQTVQGVGPRLALTVLSVLQPDELRTAVSSEDEKMLTRVPGVGKKSASRMILDLAGKLGDPGEQVAPVGAETLSSSEAAEVQQALVGLGWSSAQADDAIAAVSQTKELGDASALLRAALRYLGNR